jgi:hypothetical protein
MGFVYCLWDSKNNISRIGKTKNGNKKRQLNQLGYYPFKLVEFTIEVENYDLVEKLVHNNFKQNKINGDWYTIKPNAILSYIMENFEWYSYDFPSLHIILKNIHNK